MPTQQPQKAQMQPHDATQAAQRVGRLIFGVVAVACLCACADFSGISPSAKALDATALGVSNPEAPQSADSASGDSDWWLAFGDEQLNRLIAQAISASPGLHATQVRLTRAQASSALAQSLDGPKVNAALDLTRQLYSANNIYPPPIGGAILNSGSLQASAGWELDFFGKNRAALEAALGQVRAAQADARAARGLLAANVARTYFQLVRIQSQLALAQRTVAQREHLLALVHSRVNAGLDTQLELRQSESALPEARLQIALLQEQKELALNALAALCSQSNTALALELPAVNAIKNVAIAQSMPLDLLGRRSDIAAARWRIEAALQEVDAAKAQFYPNINLMAFAGFSSIGFDKLLQTGSDQWGVGPAVHLPLFDAGRLRANLRGKAAELDGAVESYNAQVIEAIHEVADRLASAQAIGRQQAEQAGAKALADAAYSIAQERYQAGLGNYLSVLSAETPVLVQRRQGVDLAARALDTQVQILNAIGTRVSPVASR